MLRLTGTFRQDRHGRRTDEGPVGEKLDGRAPPAELTERQRAVWVEIMADIPPDMLRTLDRELMARYVTVLDRHRQASEAQAKADVGRELPFLVKRPDGGVGLSPYIRVMERSASSSLRQTM
jgi:hypothetical protein